MKKRPKKIYVSKSSTYTAFCEGETVGLTRDTLDDTIIAAINNWSGQLGVGKGKKAEFLLEIDLR